MKLILIILCFNLINSINILRKPLLIKNIISNFDKANYIKKIKNVSKNISKIFTITNYKSSLSDEKLKEVIFFNMLCNCV
jgi:glycyl-tRNA synthetase alpha subunit